MSSVFGRLGSFTAQIGAGLRVDELETFRHGLEQLNDELRGEAVLASIEHCLVLSIACRPNGALSVTGELDDGMGSGNVLSFTIDGLDQTDLRAMLSALSAIEQDYPALGRP